jgi:hypothetical protein
MGRAWASRATISPSRDGVDTPPRPRTVEAAANPLRVIRESTTTPIYEERIAVLDVDGE